MSLQRSLPDNPAREGWGLSAEAFQRLLAILDADEDKAAHAYEQLRRRTSGLLQWWGAPVPDDLADRTLDRVARKLEEGAVIANGALGAYVRGVARMVFYEWSREPRHQNVEPLQFSAPESTDREPADLVCFDRCLASLDEGDRSLVLRYYDDGKPKEIRRELAAELGLTLTALRIRTHRLRNRLERCVSACAAGQ
jgi:DNA-directed RNA polymerase specialized sigma24 family protein